MDKLQDNKYIIFGVDKKDTKTIKDAKMNAYAGIGSRNTPKDILKLMGKIAKYLENAGFTLYSGGADGADSAFANAVNDKIIFLPWNGFNGVDDGICKLGKKHFELAEKMHPAWSKCSQGVRKLHARNTQQILGKDLDSKVRFVVCWTEDGKKIGGTATAIRLAEKNDIKVYNLGNKKVLEKFKQILKDAK